MKPNLHERFGHREPFFRAKCENPEVVPVEQIDALEEGIMPYIGCADEEDQAAWKKKAPKSATWNLRRADYKVEQLARASAYVGGMSGNPHLAKIPDGLTKEACHLPHHRPDGALVWRGVTAAWGVLQGARGGVKLTRPQKLKAARHIATHYADFDEERPKITVAEVVDWGWDVTDLENTYTSVPYAFKLFSTYPTVNKNRIALTYLTTKNSIGSLQFQYLNKNHIMAGKELYEGVTAEHDAILGVMLTAKLTDEPVEPRVFLDKPVDCVVLSVIWPLSRYGAEMLAKIREAIRKEDQQVISASWELFYREIGFIWRKKLYQEGVSEGEDAEALEQLYECLDYKNGYLRPVRKYEGSYPVMLVGGRDGTVLFTGAGILDKDADPAYPDTKGQYDLLAEAFSGFLAAAGNQNLISMISQSFEIEEATDDMEKLKELLSTWAAEELPGIVATIVAAEVKKITPAADGTFVINEKTLAAAIAGEIKPPFEAMKPEYEAAVATEVEKQVAEEKTNIAESFAAREKNRVAVAELLSKHEVPVKPKDEIKKDERAIASERVDEYLKAEDPIMAAKADILGLPAKQRDLRPGRTAPLPAGGDSPPEGEVGVAPDMASIMSGDEVATDKQSAN